MPRGSRRNHFPAFKPKALLAGVKGGKTISKSTSLKRSSYSPGERISAICKEEIWLFRAKYWAGCRGFNFVRRHCRTDLIEMITVTTWNGSSVERIGLADCFFT